MEAYMADVTEKAPQYITTTIRFDEYTRQVVDKAASLLNQSRTSFLLSIAREHAEAVIKERTETMREMETLVLSPKASLDVVSTLEKPPRPNKAARKAMQTYNKHYGKR